MDRTAKNPNLLRWHNNLYLIDHGASLYFQHNWSNIAQAATSRFTAVRQHLLLKWASGIRAADELLRGKLSLEFFNRLVAELPGEWLMDDAAARREGYREFFAARWQDDGFVEEALEAHAERF